MNSTRYRTAPDPKLTTWPPGVGFIIGNEGCERFSYYGMRAILYIYVTGLYMNLLNLAEKEAGIQATQTVHLFYTAVYAFPMIGAILADRYWGKYRTIMNLSFVYCLGHLALALFENPAWQQRWFGTVFIDPRQGLYLGLALIGIGSGGIKPCVSAHVGDQFGKGNWHLLAKVFNAFYFMINFGSLFATLLMPYIRGERHVDPQTGLVTYEGSVAWAFGVPGILMGLATLCFWAGRNRYVHVPPTHPGKLGLLDVLAGSALFFVIGIPVFASEFIHEWAGDERQGTLWVLAGSAVSLAVFFVLFTIRQRIEQDDGFLAVMFYSLGALRRGRRAPAENSSSPLARHWFFGPAVEHFGAEVVQGPIAVLRIISVFIFVCVFWSLFDQHSSTWIRQAQLMDREIAFDRTQWMTGGACVGAITLLAAALALSRKLDRRLLAAGIGALVGAGIGYFCSQREPFELHPDQVPAANPFLVMVLIPYTTFGLYPLMRRCGWEPTPLRRMAIGMFIASLSYALVAVLQQWIDGGSRVHILWQMLPYVVITIAEVMVSITGLEFAYSQAPKRMKSVIMSFWSFNVALGNVLVAYIAKAQQAVEQWRGAVIPLATFFWVFCGLMALAAMAFAIRAAFYHYRDYTQ